MKSTFTSLNRDSGEIEVLHSKFGASEYIAIILASLHEVVAALPLKKQILYPESDFEIWKISLNQTNSFFLLSFDISPNFKNL